MKHSADKSPIGPTLPMKRRRGIDSIINRRIIRRQFSQSSISHSVFPLSEIKRAR
jgi:hypothetical protein